MFIENEKSLITATHFMSVFFMHNIFKMVS
jgi:hypothetical protein